MIFVTLLDLRFLYTIGRPSFSQICKCIPFVNPSDSKRRATGHDIISVVYKGASQEFAKSFIHFDKVRVMYSLLYQLTNILPRKKWFYVA